MGERDFEKYTVRFRVLDSAENGAKISAETGMIEMSLMKRASPVSPAFTRSAMRAKYKIPALSRVASLYSAFGNLPALKKISGFQVIALSELSSRAAELMKFKLPPEGGQFKP